jgi:dTMP kinase
MFIVIEGLDGSGKSTVSQSLAKKLNAELLTTPGSCFKDIRKQLDDNFADIPKARQLIYMASVLNVSAKIKELKTEAQHVVVDRYWLSTQVYHCWMSGGHHFKLREVEDELLKPDLTVYLDLPMIERSKRIKFRNNHTHEDLQTLTHQADDELRELYYNMRNSQPVGKWLQVDALKDIDSIINTILDNACKLGLAQPECGV